MATRDDVLHDARMAAYAAYVEADTRVALDSDDPCELADYYQRLADLLRLLDDQNPLKSELVARARAGREAIRAPRRRANTTQRDQWDEVIESVLAARRVLTIRWPDDRPESEATDRASRLWETALYAARRQSPEIAERLLAREADVRRAFASHCGQQDAIFVLEAALRGQPIEWTERDGRPGGSLARKDLAKDFFKRRQRKRQ